MASDPVHLVAYPRASAILVCGKPAFAWSGQSLRPRDRGRLFAGCEQALGSTAARIARCFTSEQLRVKATSEPWRVARDLPGECRDINCCYHKGVAGRLGAFPATAIAQEGGSVVKTEWDYTELAVPYLKRPDYAPAVIDAILDLESVPRSPRVCDVGAGVAHLTLMLANRGASVVAVEPNDAMRQLGSARTGETINVDWYEGTGESTGQPSDSFDVVTFGSSFNVCDRGAALVETSRILKSEGWFVCMWNHRDLEDALQRRIEAIIRESIPSFDYGSRRADQTKVIVESGLYRNVNCGEYAVTHEVAVEDLIEGWRSHGTLERQAGPDFTRVVAEIEDAIRSLGLETIPVPYVTRAWFAQVVKP